MIALGIAGVLLCGLGAVMFAAGYKASAIMIGFGASFIALGSLALAFSIRAYLRKGRLSWTAHTETVVDLTGCTDPKTAEQEILKALRVIEPDEVVSASIRLPIGGMRIVAGVTARFSDSYPSALSRTTFVMHPSEAGSVPVKDLTSEDQLPCAELDLIIEALSQNRGVSLVIAVRKD